MTLTNWQPLDPLIAILMGVHITVSGVQLVRTAVLELMDTALPPTEVEQLVPILQQHLPPGVSYHALPTRQSGRQRFITLHIQVPGPISSSTAKMAMSKGAKKEIGKSRCLKP